MMSNSSFAMFTPAADEQARFLHLARSPELWLDSAEMLKHAADMLLIEMDRGHRQSWATAALTQQWSQHREGPKPHFCLEDESLNRRLGQVYFHLAGLCVENLLKGILVHAHPEYVKEDGELGSSLKKHDLSLLAKDASLDGELTPAEREFLELAATAVVYWGRYHIPRDFERMQSQWGWNDEHFATFNVLYRRWAERLIRLFAVSDYGTTFPGDCNETRMNPDEYVRWRLDRKRPGEA